MNHTTIAQIISAVIGWLRAKQSAFFLLVGAGISLAVGFERIGWTEVQIVLVIDFLAALWAFAIASGSVPKADMEAWIEAAVRQAKAHWDAEIANAALDDSLLTFPSTLVESAPSSSLRVRSKPLSADDS